MTTPPPPRIAIWTAVSSKPQAGPDKTSLQDQEAAGRQLAQAVGGHVVAVYSVPGHSRDLIFWHDAEASMPAYAQLRQDCADHIFDVLFALDPDRLGRDPALSNQVISLVEKSGAEVYFASAPHPIGQASTAQRYIYAIQSVRAAEDQTLRIHRFRAGIEARVTRGLCSSHWPLGYRPIPGPNGRIATAEPHPDLAPAVLLATKLFIEGLPYTRIAQALNASPYHPPRGSRWAYSTVQKMMANDVYAGFPHFDHVEPEYPSPHYPALWDPDTHAAVIRERNRRRRDRYNKTAGSPLAGVVFCARCGHQMSRQLAHHKHWWLRCTKHAHRSHTGVSCHRNYIREDRVVAHIATYLAALATPAALDAALIITDDTTQLHQEISALGDHLAELEVRRQRLALALAAGQMDPQVYRSADDLLLADVVATRSRLLDLQVLLAAAPDPAQRRAALEALAAIFPDLVATAPPVRTRTLLQNAGLRVEIEAGAITSIRLV